MTLWKTLKRPPWRTVVPACCFLLLLAAGHGLWRPGLDVSDGRDDKKQNGVWLQHGWIGGDSWFVENDRTDRKPFFRNDASVRALAQSMADRHITDVFPHLCPTLPDGKILPVDDTQTDRFLVAFSSFRVLPWVGGVLNVDVVPDDAKRRYVFVQSIAALLRRHADFAGVHLNVEPWPSGNQPMLVLLDKLRHALPPGKILSVAAYPPPTRWHPYPDVHWDEAYFKEVARRVDQLVVMLYDTGLKDGKLYQFVMATWTEQVLEWTNEQPRTKSPVVLLGVPTYDDSGVDYHLPAVENLPNALSGIHAGLNHFPHLPANYQGVAVYSEWETSDAEWRYWRTHFINPKNHYVHEQEQPFGK